jgi:hypothetical protein
MPPAPACLEAREYRATAPATPLLVATAACRSGEVARWLRALSTLGAGVELAPSTFLRGSDGTPVRGLRAQRAFAAGEYVTVYEFTATVASSSSDYKLKLPGSSGRVLVGLEVPAPGRGGGSFANDNVNVRASVRASDTDVLGRTRVRRYAANPINADFVYVLSARQAATLESERAALTSVTAVVVRATRDIAVGDELLVDYGTAYWAPFIAEVLREYRAALGNPVVFGASFEPECRSASLPIAEAAAATLPVFLAFRYFAGVGRGVVACARIRARVFLEQYQGRVSLEPPADTDHYALFVRFDELNAVPHYISAESPDALAADVTAVTVPAADPSAESALTYSALEQQTNWTRYVNSGTSARDDAVNCVFDGSLGRRVRLLTTRVIEPGQELRVYYGSRFFGGEPDEYTFSVYEAGVDVAEGLARLRRRWGARYLPAGALVPGASLALLADSASRVDGVEHILAAAIVYRERTEVRVAAFKALEFLAEPNAVFERMVDFLDEYARAQLSLGRAAQLRFVLAPHFVYGGVDRTADLREMHALDAADGSRLVRPLVTSRLVDRADWRAALTSVACSSARGRRVADFVESGAPDEHRLYIVYDGDWPYTREAPYAVAVYARTLEALVFVCVVDDATSDERQSPYGAPVFEQIIVAALERFERRQALGRRPLRVGVDDDAALTIALTTRGYRRVRVTGAERLAFVDAKAVYEE